MTSITTIGVDLAKNVFQLTGLDGDGVIVWRKRLRRAAFTRFMERHDKDCLVGFEACGGANHWGRWLMGLGYRVKMMPPRAVKAYLPSRHKSDARDADAIAEAATRAHVRGVPVRSEAAQARALAMRLRERQIRQRTQIVNQLRSALHEHGFTVAKGREKGMKEVAQIMASEAWEELPDLVREVVAVLWDEIVALDARIEASTARIVRAGEEAETTRRLMTIPGIKAISAAVLASHLEDPRRFAGARAFAAYLGLVPRDCSSGERRGQGRITKQGSREARRLLFLGARAILANVGRSRQPKDGLRIWAAHMLARKPWDVAVVALAHKLARIAWAVAARECDYRSARITVCTAM